MTYQFLTTAVADRIATITVNRPDKLNALNDATILGRAPLGDGFLWFAVKMSLVLLIFLWIRATFPRYRYDQIMRLGWKVFIPVTLVWIVFIGAMMQTRYAGLFH